MEPIGQKIVVPSTDEAVLASDIVDETMQNDETRIFDTTLDGALAENQFDENVIEELIGGEKLSESLNVDNLPESRIDSKVPNISVSKINNPESNIALEVMEEILLSENVSSEQIKIQQNSEQKLHELVEKKSSVYGNDESKSDLILSEEILEPKIVSEVLKEKNENSDNNLQSFFHYANPQENKPAFFEDVQDGFLKKNNIGNNNFGSSKLVVDDSESFKLEPSELESVLPEKTFSESNEINKESDFKDSNREVILTKIGNKKEKIEIESELSNSQLDPDLNQKKDLTGQFQEKNNLVQGLKSSKETHEEKIPEELQKISMQESENVTEGLRKFEGVHLDNTNKNELPKIFENVKATQNSELEEKIVGTEFPKVSEGSKILSDQQLFSEKVSDEILMQRVTNKLSGDQQLLPKDGLEEFDISSKQNFKITEEQQITKNSLNEDAPPITKENKVHDVQKVFVKDGIVEVKKIVENYKKLENQQISSRDNVGEFFISEASNKKVSEDQKLFSKDDLDEVLMPNRQNYKITETQQKLTEGIEFKGNQYVGKSEESDDVLIDEQSKISDGFRITGKDNTKDILENNKIEHLNKAKINLTQEGELPVNTKSTTDSITSTGINTLSEVPTISNIKVGETTNTVIESFRNTDMPFEVEQVVSRVRILRGNGVEEMTLRLHPEDLGQMTLKTRQSGTDLMIDMRVENPQAKQLIESGFDSLRNRFLDNEFSYQDLALNVDINERDSQFGRDRKNSGFEDEIITAERAEKQEVEQLEETPRMSSQTDSGLNLYV